MDWTPQAIKFLTDNYFKMKTAQIAEALGTTKNSVVGKARRIRISNADPVPMPNPEPSEKTEPSDAPIWIKFSELGKNQCHWPNMKNLSADEFCGCECKEGSSYCEKHHARAYKKNSHGVPKPVGENKNEIRKRYVPDVWQFRKYT